MPGALLRTALSTDMRMSCSLADQGNVRLRGSKFTQGHLAGETDMRFSLRRARVCPPVCSPSSVTQGHTLEDLEEVPVYEAWCPEWKLNLYHADLAKSIQCTSTMFLSHRTEHSPEH